MRPDTLNWIASARYDLETARHMLATGRYLYVVCLCHLALEKALKAHVTEVTQTVPAKTHDLVYLIKKAGLTLPDEHLRFLTRLNAASLITRYPEDLPTVLREYAEPVAKDYLRRTEEVFSWLIDHPNLRES